MLNKLQKTSKWTQKAPLPSARSHPSIAGAKGKLYIFGGGANNFASLNSVFSYDPFLDKWDQRQPMPTARSGTIALTIDDKVYVLGGGFKKPDGNFKFLNTVEIYDPIHDSWHSGPEMIMPHDYPAGAYLDGYIYILGGHHPDATTSGPKTDPGFEYCERLCLTSGKWEKIARLPTARFALTAIAYNGKIMASGGVAFTSSGFNNFDIIEQYDPKNNAWAPCQQMSLPWPAAGHSTILHNEKLYIFGGYSGDGIQSRAALYDFKSKSWDHLPLIPEKRAAAGIGSMGNSIYLFGGWADDGRTPVDSVFEFSP